jgi:hypothetical protein
VLKCLKDFPLLHPSKEYNKEKAIKDIIKILDPGNRRYLKVYHLERGTSLTNVIFQAVFKSINIYLSSS